MTARYCTTCGAALTGQRFCVNCGAEATPEPEAGEVTQQRLTPLPAPPVTPAPPVAAPAPRPVPAPAPAPAPEPAGDDSGRKGVTTMVIIGAVVILALVAVIGYLLGTSSGGSKSADRGPEQRVQQASPEPPVPTTPAPTTPAPSTAPPPTPAALTWRCWDGAQVTDSGACPAPSGRRGMEAVSPTFAWAMANGRCYGDPTTHTVGSQQCRVGGALVHFAWYASRAEMDAYFRDHYPVCNRLPAGWLERCGGADKRRVGLRFTDPSYLFEVTVAREQASVLDAVKLQQAQPTR